MTARGTPGFVYFPDQCLGAGATASVHVGRHKRKGWTCAVKVYQRGDAMEAKYLERELEVMKRLSHDNIVKFISIENENMSGKPVLIMELCSEGSLLKVLERPENYFGFSEEELLVFFRDITNALKYLHQEKIVHRDIKPGNILCHIRDDSTCIYKLTDFGASKELADNDDPYTSICGTEEYLHPEVYRVALMPGGRSPWGGGGQRRSQFNSSMDLWSVGVTLYQVATGQLPFQSYGGRNNKDDMYRIISQKKAGVISGVQKSQGGEIVWSKNLPPTCRLSRGLRKELTTMLDYLLESDPKRRWDFNKFFDEARRITTSLVICIYAVATCREDRLYINRNEITGDEPYTAAHLRDALAEMIELPESSQIFIHEKFTLSELIKPADASWLPSNMLTSPESPVYIVPSQVISTGEADWMQLKYEQFNAAKFPSVAVTQGSVRDDVIKAREACGFAIHLLRCVEQLHRWQQHYVKLVQILRSNLTHSWNEFSTTAHTVCDLLEPLMTSQGVASCDVRLATNVKSLQDAAAVQPKSCSLLTYLSESTSKCITGMECINTLRTIVKNMKKIYEDFKRKPSDLSHNDEQIHRFEKKRLLDSATSGYTISKNTCYHSTMQAVNQFQNWHRIYCEETSKDLAERHSSLIFEIRNTLAALVGHLPDRGGRLQTSETQTPPDLSIILDQNVTLRASQAQGVEAISFCVNPRGRVAAAGGSFLHNNLDSAFYSCHPNPDDETDLKNANQDFDSHSENLDVTNMSDNSLRSRGLMANVGSALSSAQMEETLCASNSGEMSSESEVSVVTCGTKKEVDLDTKTISRPACENNIVTPKHSGNMQIEKLLCYSRILDPSCWHLYEREKEFHARISPCGLKVGPRNREEGEFPLVTKSFVIGAGDHFSYRSISGLEYVKLNNSNRIQALRRFYMQMPFNSSTFAQKRPGNVNKKLNGKSTYAFPRTSKITQSDLNNISLEHEGYFSPHEAESNILEAAEIENSLLPMPSSAIPWNRSQNEYVSRFPTSETRVKEGLLTGPRSDAEQGPGRVQIPTSQRVHNRKDLLSSTILESSTTSSHPFVSFSTMQGIYSESSQSWPSSDPQKFSSNLPLEIKESSEAQRHIDINHSAETGLKTRTDAKKFSDGFPSGAVTLASNLKEGENVGRTSDLHLAAPDSEEAIIDSDLTSSSFTRRDETDVKVASRNVFASRDAETRLKFSDHSMPLKSRGLVANPEMLKNFPHHSEAVIEHLPCPESQHLDEYDGYGTVGMEEGCKDTRDTRTFMGDSRQSVGVEDYTHTDHRLTNHNTTKPLRPVKPDLNKPRPGNGSDSNKPQPFVEYDGNILPPVVKTDATPSRSVRNTSDASNRNVLQMPPSSFHSSSTRLQQPRPADAVISSSSQATDDEVYVGGTIRFHRTPR